MGYLTNSGTGFLKDAVTTVSNVKSYLVNKTGYLVDAIRVGIGDFGQRVLDDGGTVEASAEAAASYREITKEIYDQASLVLFPSGYKDNLVYSHKPVDGSADFTYTRGTDTATRVGADGYIKKERANLLEQSNQFDTTWIVNTSVSEGEEGYDGTNDAWSLTRAAGGSLMAEQQNVTLSGVSTYSIYAKINPNNGIGLAFNNLSTAARFDLRDATKTQAVTETGIISSSQKYVGNGFYRLSITADVSGSTQLRIYLTTADAITSDGNGGTHIIQDAQVEQGLVATPYIETTTAPVYEGLTDNLPRIDYTGGTPSILLEPSRANKVTQSEYLGSWFSSGGTLTPNAAISPEGVQNAYSYTNSAFTTLRYPVTLSTSTQYTFSFYAKNVDATNARYRVYDDTNATDIISATSYFSQLSTNEWKRIEVTFTTSATGTAYGVYLESGNQSGEILFYGAQLEEGSYATSYIPTYNASATRAADSFNTLTYADDFSSLTFYAEVEMKDILRDGSTPIIRFGDTSSNDGAIRIFRNSDTNSKRAVILTRNLSGDNILNYTSVEDRVKIKITYDSTSPNGDWELFINGNSEETATSTDFNEFDTLDISGEGGQARIYKMYIKNSPLI